MAKQIRTLTHEHGRVYAQVEQFDRARAGEPKPPPHLALQPVAGGPAHRFPLRDPETDEMPAETAQLLEDYPDLRQVLEEEPKAKARKEA